MSRTLAERAATQAAVAGAEASLRAARALYYATIDTAWRAGQLDQPVPVALRNDLRLAATHAVRTSAEVARAMYELAGGSAIYDHSPLQRHFRDAHTATAHFQVNEASREFARADPARPARRRIDALTRQHYDHGRFAEASTGAGSSTAQIRWPRAVLGPHRVDPVAD